MRLISARPAGRRERETYHDQIRQASHARTDRRRKDEDIDFSDVPELDDGFWREAKLVEPDRTVQITLRVKGSVLAHFKASGRGFGRPLPECDTGRDRFSLIDCVQNVPSGRPRQAAELLADIRASRTRKLLQGRLVRGRPLRPALRHAKTRAMIKRLCIMSNVI